MCTNKYANNNHMLKIIRTISNNIRNKSNNNKLPIFFIISWTRFFLLGLICSKTKLMKTFGDLLVARKKLLSLYSAEWNPFICFNSWLLNNLNGLKISIYIHSTGTVLGFILCFCFSIACVYLFQHLKLALWKPLP